MRPVGDETANGWEAILRLPPTFSSSSHTIGQDSY